MDRGPKNTFGKHVLKTAGISALMAAGVTADAGNPLLNLAVGAVGGAVGGAVHHVVKSVQAANDNARQKNRNLGRQFD